MYFFEYNESEINALKKKDKRLALYIDQIGMIEREVFPNLFIALVNSIIGQQISTKALVTVWGRMQKLIGDIIPENVIKHSDEAIQSCGMTMKKVGYIKEAAQKIISNELDLGKLLQVSDEEVIRQMTQLNGIGVWTAEMLMIFSMQRRNIFSFDDIAIHRGLRMVYRHKRITKELFERYRKRYTPYASIASLYLWKIASGVCGLEDCAPKREVKKKSMG